MMKIHEIQNLIDEKENVLDNDSTDDERFIEVNDDPKQYYSYNGHLTHTLWKYSEKVIRGHHIEYSHPNYVDVFYLYYK